MTDYNIKAYSNLEDSYQQGLLPQRNHKDLFYSDSSCRSNLKNYSLTSENRRILKKTSEFQYKKIPLSQFNLDPSTQKNIKNWINQLGWDFPISSVKTIINHHIFNTAYVWSYQNKVVAIAICYFSDNISHIAYVFYDPQYKQTSLPIRMVLQVVIDSFDNKLRYCYLGRFSKESGYYKRNMPGFEYYYQGNWILYNGD